MVQAIVVAATAWGPRHGGINSFNADFCLALAEVLPPTYRLICFVLHASREDVRRARRAKVHLIPLSPPDKPEAEEGFRPSHAHQIVQLLESLQCNNVAWWVGHDVFSGGLLHEAKKLLGTGKLAVIHHMDYGAYTALPGGDGKKALQKRDEQADVLALANTVFAIGPRLVESARALRRLRDKPHERCVVELVPGLPQISSMTPGRAFRAIAFGRLDKDHDAIKQVSLVAAGFGRALKRHPGHFGSNPELTILGISAAAGDQESKRLHGLVARYAGRLVNARPAPFLEDRSRVLQELRQNSVCLMLSLNEGFGLVGWEAIGAEVPLVISQNSGLYDLIKASLGGRGLGCVYPIDVKGATGPRPFSEQDVTAVAQALYQVSQDPASAKKNANALKKMLIEEREYTWHNAAVKFAQACRIPTIWDRSKSFARVLQAAVPADSLKEHREEHFGQVFKHLERNGRGDRLLVLFGGVSSTLCDKTAASRYARWLIGRGDRRIFVCFEAGVAARRRAETLDAEALTADSGLPLQPKARMRVKESRVRRLKQRMGGLVSPGVLDRLVLIPLKTGLTNYVIVTDAEIYLAPVMHRRSSETLSIRIPLGNHAVVSQVIGYMKFHLASYARNEAKALLGALSRLASIGEGK